MQKQYRVIEAIGSGSFGVVKKVARLKDEKIFVAKEMKYGMMNSHEKQQLISEVNILKELSHQHIVKYHDRIVDKNSQIVYILMEYCEGGDLGTIIRDAQRKKDLIPEQVIWKVFTQIASALNFCHTRPEGKVLHRDIKPANIFIDITNSVKLGDFGLSREMGEHSEFAKSKVGTPFYMSPEQISDKGYNQKSDVWATGCILYEMAALKRPFEAKNHFALAEKIRAGKFDRIPFRYSENLHCLIRDMLEVRPERRISTAQILEIPMISMRLDEQKLKSECADLFARNEFLEKKEAKLRAQKIVCLERLEDKQNHMHQFNIEL